jgi:acetolactate synthase-1/2/3 large subunit
MSAPAAGKTRTGAQILVANLAAQGATRVFGVPGESYLAVLDALYDAREQVAFVTCRQEGGAAYMAEAHGKLTGRPGVAIVTRGPGATNASIGVHVAAQDSTPMLLLIGQVGRDFADREAFQEVDYRRMFGSIAKWAAQIDDAARVPEYVAHAYRVAMAGRPGPVVLALPEDMLAERAQCADVARVSHVAAVPDAADVERAHALLAAAQSPLVIVGGSRWDPDACAALAAYARDNALPVAAAFRRQDLFDNRRADYAGDIGIGVNPKLAQRIREADVLLVIGERLGEMTTSGYALLDAPLPKQRLIHVHPGAEELGRVYQPAVAIAATPGAFIDALAKLSRLPGWPSLVESARADCDAWRAPRPVPGAVDLWRIVQWLDERLPDDAIVANGAGNFATWMHRIFRYRRFGTQLGPYAGSMGYGVPAAIAAKLLHRDRVVIAWSGDGDFLMTGQELATAFQYDVPIVVVVVDNGMYGTIRMHQEREYPARVWGTDLVNPDFAALARAYGAHGETVEATDAFAPAFERALESGKPALLHVKVDPQALTMNASLDAIRAQAEAKMVGRR